jgi:RimJ/RimL family protein N-acetyltransferase
VTASWVTDDDTQLRTPRLRLRRPHVEDALDALVLLHDAEVVRWNPAPAVVDLASAADWCARGADWSAGDHATWHAIDPGSGHLVANVSIFAIDREHATAKVGYRVAPQWRGHGRGTEALSAVSAWAFDAMRLQRIQLEHAVANTASCRVATNSGYVLEGVLRSAYRDLDGARHDEHVHGRLATGQFP